VAENLGGRRGFFVESNNRARIVISRRKSSQREVLRKIEESGGITSDLASVKVLLRGSRS